MTQTPNPTQSARMPDYKNMDAGDFLKAVGTDAMKWADAFQQIKPPIEHDVMFAWFANAIENVRESGIRSDLAIPKDKLQGWIEAMERISRMTTLPDHKANTMTLVAAHTIAREVAAEMKEMVK